MDLYQIPSPFDPPIRKGGPGSGNHGHAGRPGERGGSEPNGGTQEHAVRERGKGKFTAPAEWKKKLTPVELEAMRHYSESGHGHINTSLRNGSAQGAEAKQNIDRLNSAIDKAGDGEARTLYRGVGLLNAHVNYAPGSQGLKEFDQYMASFEKNIGKTIKLSGFQSTTVNPQVAETFAGHPNNPIFEIKTGRGAPIDGLSGHAGEEEVLLGHNWRYKVGGVLRGVPFKTSSGKIAKRTVIQLEVVK